MKRFKPWLFVIALLVPAGFAGVPNVQFKDLSGKSYDLYQLLNRGTSVYMHVTATW